MLRLISDHNFNRRILRGLRRRRPTVDLVRAVDVGLSEADDRVLLEWAAAEGRILVTHDVNTIPGFANDRVRAGLPMPGVLLVPKSVAIGQAISDLELAIEAQTADDCKDQVL
jgi:hypothetical protein